MLRRFWERPEIGRSSARCSRPRPGSRPRGGSLLVLRGLLPALLAVATGALIGAVQRGTTRWPGRSPSSASCSCCFQVLTPLHHAVERQPRQPHRGVALRPADDRVHRRRRASRTSSEPDLTTDLTVARDFDLGITGPPLSISDGLHRERPRRDGRRPRVRRSCCSRSRGGRRSLLIGAWVLDALAAARERGVAGPQHRRGAHRAAPRRLRVPARGRRARGQGGAPVRAVRLGDRPLRRAPARASTSCSGRRRGCASVRARASLALVLAANVARRSGRSPTPPPTARISLDRADRLPAPRSWARR